MRMASEGGDRDVDCSNACRGVWLVKVPKYIAEKWKKAAPLSEAGRIKISRQPNGTNDITFKLSNVAEEEKIPTDHKFVISNIQQQSLAVYSQPKAVNEDGIECGQGKICLEGSIVQKGECRPIGNDIHYMDLKRRKIMEASQPKRAAIGLERVVQNFKPVARHVHQVEYEARKKNEGKKARGDRDQVLEMLFAAFEKHQYYNIKDLERITKQPAPFLKELLKEVCNYNVKNPHRNMWELKPEYRHYKKEGEEKAATAASSSSENKE
ncbi:general transcription factor IIF subunit 2 [Galendromus occidentalis]|uniref:General transcription factor IIF subunit 2 n=1 Tax=Galendromus occidentalis TaxID=34638 RepID=A0AAJ6QML7_9ACAR|nr:general transcription factor IIF subunit 2 [Galendromus occidentalis]